MSLDDAFAAQRLLFGLTDDRTRFAQDQFCALYRECLDAERGLDDGGDYFSIPF